METMKEALNARNVKPMTNVNGTPVVTFEEQRNLSQDAIKDEFSLGMHEFNPDGTVKRSRVLNAAVNEDRFYDNRYRVVDGQLELVTAQTTDGYRVITEQASGRVAYKQIQVFVFARTDKKLAFVESRMISDDTFITDFTHKLSKDAMVEILPLIPSDGSNIAEEKLPI